MWKKLTLRQRRSIEGLGFVTPWFLGFLVFMAYPLIYSLYMSFTDVQVTATKVNMTFVGWKNFQYAFLQDNVFPVDLMNFVIESAITVPLIVIFSLLVGLMINEEVPGRAVFRAIFFLPVIFSTGEVIMTIFSQGAGGASFVERFEVFQMLITALPEQLANPVNAIMDRFTLVLWNSGVQILVFLAALKTIGANVYEAAAIDGASRWEVFWKIVLPALTPFIILNTVYTIVDLSLSPFNPVLGSVSNHMFNVRTGMGYASAIGWIYFVVVLLALGLVFALGMRKLGEL